VTTMEWIRKCGSTLLGSGLGIWCGSLAAGTCICSKSEKEPMQTFD